MLLPVSVGYVNYQPVLMDAEGLRAFCQALEDLGYAGVQVQDHVAYPWDEAAYGYSAGGKMAHRPGQHVLEAFSFLAAAATASDRLQLETSVLVLPQRHPLLVAKQAATIDRLSGGRLLLGLGPGWLRAETAAMGWDPATRGARMDEALELVVRALDDERVSYHGTHFSVSEVSLEPRPPRPARELVWIGGGEAGGLDATMRRLGRYGRGWLVNPRLPFEEVPGALATAREHAEAAGRSGEGFGLDFVLQFDGDEDRAADAVARRWDAGATRISVFLGGLEPAGSVDELIDLATRFRAVAEATPR